MVTSLARLVMAAGIALVVALSAQAKESPASAVVREFHDSLLGVMKRAESLGYRGRFEALSPALEQTFNLPIMARIVAGRYWGRFTPEQRAALTEAFSRMTKATYANRFDGYSGETFRIVGEVSIRGQALLVKSQLVKRDGEKVKLDYLLREFDSRWQVVDVYLKGSVSELATRRSEYSSVLRREGLDALIVMINGKVAMYERENGPK